MTRATYTSQLTGIPRSQEIDSSGLGKNYFLTSSSKGVIPGLTRNLPLAVREHHSARNE